MRFDSHEPSLEDLTLPLIRKGDIVVMQKELTINASEFLDLILHGAQQFLLLVDRYFDECKEVIIAQDSFIAADSVHE